MKNRAERWNLYGDAEPAAEALDSVLEFAIEALKCELQDGATAFEAFRVANTILWFELARHAEFGARDTLVREKAWQLLTERAAPSLGYSDPEVLLTDLCQWDRFYV